MYRSARPLLGLGSAAMRPQQPFTRVLPAAKRIAASPSVAVTARRCYASKFAADMRMSSRQNKKASQADGGYSASEIEKSMTMAHIMLPGTFVTLPFSQLDKSPKALWAYTYARLKQRVLDFFGVFGAKVQSMPNWTTKPRCQLSYTKIVPEAKELHRRLGEALAAGDKDTLREICTPALYQTLSAVISRRKATEKLTWELLRYDGKPRIVSHKVAMMPPLGKAPVMQQAVVAISSSQKLDKIEKSTNKPVKGGLRVQNQTEYFVMTRQFNPKTWAPKKWIAWGNTQATTMEDWKMIQKGMKDMEQKDYAKRKGERL